jgi:hypothetical protein
MGGANLIFNLVKDYEGLKAASPATFSFKSQSNKPSSETAFFMPSLSFVVGSSP